MKVLVAPSGIKLIRHPYCPRIKRGKRVVVATLARGTREIPTDIAALLKEPERQLVQSVLDELRREEDRLARYMAAKDLSALIAQATEYYCAPTPPIGNLAALASSTRDAFSGLLNAMVKAGVGRTRNRPSKKKTK